MDKNMNKITDEDIDEDDMSEMLDEDTSGMTDEQKEIYYVTTISRLSFDQYKFRIGQWISIGLAVMSCRYSETNLATASLALAIYCNLAKELSNELQSEAHKKLIKCNENKGKNI